MAWWVALAVGIVLQIIVYLLMPKPKREKPPEVDELEDPTAEAGRPIPVIFGTTIIKSPNILWYGNKDIFSYEIKV